MAGIVSGAVVMVDEDASRLFVVRHVAGGVALVVHESDRAGVEVAIARLARAGSARTVSCGDCGGFWVQRGNRTGHCAGCHQTFEGLTVFDAHQRVARDGSVVCLNPASMRWRGSRLRRVGGTWRGPGLPSSVFEDEEQGND